MATKRYHVCRECGERYGFAESLFDVLLNHTRGKKQLCTKDNAECYIQLQFPFGLDAADTQCNLLDCFVPRRIETWKDKKSREVAFYPFLVILRRHNRNLAIWLPYWHIVNSQKRRIIKYGQWAPFMDLKLFRSLIAQAKMKGYVLDEGTKVSSRFSRGVSIAQLRERNCDQIPEDPGVYKVIRSSRNFPAFRKKSTGGRFKGRNPTVPKNELDKKWVKDTKVLYYGKADRNLRRRISDYLKFGKGEPRPHWGGRFIWQLKDSDKLKIAWTKHDNPRQLEQDLLKEFVSKYNKLPFANLRF